MLTSGIHAAYEVRHLLDHDKVTLLARGAESQGKNCGRGAMFSVRARDLLQHADVMNEVFGASSVIVRCHRSGDARSRRASGRAAGPRRCSSRNGTQRSPHACCPSSSARPAD